MGTRVVLRVVCSACVWQVRPGVGGGEWVCCRNWGGVLEQQRCRCGEGGGRNHSTRLHCAGTGWSRLFLLFAHSILFSLFSILLKFVSIFIILSYTQLPGSRYNFIDYFFYFYYYYFSFIIGTLSYSYTYIYTYNLYMYINRRNMKIINNTRRLDQRLWSFKMQCHNNI